MTPAAGGTPPAGSEGSLPCPQCHQTHLGLTLLLGPSAPDDWLAVSEGERLEAELTPDICIFTDNGLTRHFIRGHIQLPITDGRPTLFVWSVWVELDEDSMAQVAASWTDPNRAAIPPLQGRLANELPYPQPTRGLAISVHTRDPGLVPLLMVAEPHALTFEQLEGIAMHRVAELGSLLQRQ